MSEPVSSDSSHTAKVTAMFDDRTDAGEQLATGATTRACLRRVTNAGAAYVMLAVPVGLPEAIESLHDEADAVVCVETPSWFSAVGQFYRTFGQVPDAEAMRYLDDGS
ncbi:hypothetical protein [Natrinema limicola]|uniref:Phosphoribosyltransferase n=1 Tax=Natrinema limicola JCM 13563 TaxID=1230457 RepID=M0C6D9_9EURY|nr:phosphoribosyltransferase [Natrinema limicola JCM 13563]